MPEKELGHYDDAASEGGWDNLSPEEIAEKLNEKVAEGMINISMNTAPYFENGTADGNLMIVNESINNYDCMRKAVEFGIPKEQAILSATLIPAREIGREKEIGAIAPGKLADFVVCDGELNQKTIYLDGKKL